MAESEKTFSIVIPCYNDPEGLEVLLRSLADSVYKRFETIVVDDCSADGRVRRIAERFQARFLRNSVNRGAGFSRNLGVSQANGDVIIFLDSDVRVLPDTIGKFVRHFDDPGCSGVMGVLDSVPLVKGSIPEYSALEAHYFNCSGKHIRNELHTFCMAISKDVFSQAGGFDPEYSRGGEEWDLGYRLSQRYSFEIDAGIIVRHRFDRFPERFKLLVRRVRVWTRIFMVHREFGEKYSTLPEGLVQISGAVFLVSSPLLAAGNGLAVIPGGALAVHLYLARGFYWFVCRQRSPGFALLALGLRLIFGIAIVSGFLLGLIDQLLRKENYGGR